MDPLFTMQFVLHGLVDMIETKLFSHNKIASDGNFSMYLLSEKTTCINVASAKIKR